MGAGADGLSADADVCGLDYGVDVSHADDVDAACVSEVHLRHGVSFVAGEAGVHLRYPKGGRELGEEYPKRGEQQVCAGGIRVG